MPNPERIFGTMNAYQRTRALEAAVKLDLFSAIDEGASTVPALAERCGASERGIRILADYLVICEFLTKQNGRYGLSEDAGIFLSKRSPAYMGAAIQFLNSKTMMECFDDLETVVRRGTTLLDGEGSVDPENPMWVDFARSMAALMYPAAAAIAKMLATEKSAKLQVLDVAAGHGVFGIAIASEYPNAEVTALDWKSVLNVASENAAHAGISKRYRLLPGDAFKLPLQQKFDIILLTNFLHHFDVSTCESFLQKMHSALNDGGRVITVEFVPNDDRISPPAEAAFSLIMLASTRAGDAYTFSQFQAMFKAAGYSKSELHALEASPEHVIISSK